MAAKIQSKAFRQAQGKLTGQTGQVILHVKIGKNFARNQSKAHIPNDKIGKK
jgi:hypothetical protein